MLSCFLVIRVAGCFLVLLYSVAGSTYRSGIPSAARAARTPGPAEPPLSSRQTPRSDSVRCGTPRPFPLLLLLQSAQTRTRHRPSSPFLIKTWDWACVCVYSQAGLRESLCLRRAPCRPLFAPTCLCGWRGVGRRTGVGCCLPADI